MFCITGDRLLSERDGRPVGGRGSGTSSRRRGRSSSSCSLHHPGSSPSNHFVLSIAFDSAADADLDSVGSRPFYAGSGSGMFIIRYGSGKLKKKTIHFYDMPSNILQVKYYLFKIMFRRMLSKFPRIFYLFGSGSRSGFRAAHLEGRIRSSSRWTESTNSDDQYQNIFSMRDSVVLNLQEFLR
jgi:hypothetical protein